MTYRTALRVCTIIGIVGTLLFIGFIGRAFAGRSFLESYGVPPNVATVIGVGAGVLGAWFIMMYFYFHRRIWTEILNRR